MAPVKKPRAILGPHFLRKWREKRGISQQAAADAIHVSRELLSKIEGQKSPYLQQHVEGLAHLYGCSAADLIGADPDEKIGDRDTMLRSALLSYGIDSSDLGRAMGMIKGFLGDLYEPQQQNPQNDQSAPASRHRAKAP